MALCEFVEVCDHLGRDRCQCENAQQHGLERIDPNEVRLIGIQREAENQAEKEASDGVSLQEKLVGARTIVG